MVSGRMKGSGDDMRTGRADAAEAPVEELRRAEVAARSGTGMLKWQLDASRKQLKAVGGRR